MFFSFQTQWAVPYTLEKVCTKLAHLLRLGALRSITASLLCSVASRLGYALRLHQNAAVDLPEAAFVNLID